MGLFDGTGADGETGSTADLARLTGWPVVLVVDARGQGASVAALLRGFAEHCPGVPLAGVIFNRVAGERHRRLLAEAGARHLPDLPVLGGTAADPALRLPSRHLGLVPAGEIAGIEAVLDCAAAGVEAALDVERLLRLARPSRLDPGEAAPIPPLGQCIAVARDDAFGFTYAALLEDWRRQGADIRFFSPLSDEPPDPGADAVFLPGGYPELFAERIAAAHGFLSGLRGAAAQAKPVYGECGGYMVLGDALVDGAGHRHPMLGLLPLVTSFAESRRSLGYRRTTLLADGPLGRAGSRWRGHEFHYASVVREGRADRLWLASDAAGADLGACGLHCGSVFGSFIHLIDIQDVPASNPAI